jgi:hypothetical protein
VKSKLDEVMAKKRAYIAHPETLLQQKQQQPAGTTLGSVFATTGPSSTGTAMPTTTPSIFGQTQTTTPAFGTTSTMPGIFGQGGTTSVLGGGGSVFGGQTNVGGSVFGSTQTFQQPSTQSMQSSSPFGIQSVAQPNVSVFGPPKPQTPSTLGFTAPSSNMGVSTMDAGKISAPAGIGAFAATSGSFGLSTTPAVTQQQQQQQQQGQLQQPQQPIEGLDQKTVEAFKADRFTFGNIPETPPPPQLCM